MKNVLLITCICCCLTGCFEPVKTPAPSTTPTTNNKWDEKNWDEMNWQ